MTMTSIASTDTSLGRRFLGGPLRTAILAVAVVAVVAFAAMGWFGVSWYRAAHGRSLAVGMDRDALLGDAQRAMVTLNTLDYRRVQDGLTLWEQSTTGSLLSQLRANRDAYARAITASAAVTSARVLDAAVASLNDSAGTAEVLVGVDVTSQSEQGDPSCAHRRVQLDMVRAGSAWKVGKLAPVGDAYSEPGPCSPGTSPR
jgi:Mce-associated membrane protein